MSHNYSDLQHLVYYFYQSNGKKILIIFSQVLEDH